MTKVLMMARTFPSYHPKKGQPTYFIEKIYNSLYSKNNLMDYPVGLEVDDNIKGRKCHTIRTGTNWDIGDKFSPRVWSGKPYHSPQITIAPDITIEKVYNFVIEYNDAFYGKGNPYGQGNKWQWSAGRGDKKQFNLVCKNPRLIELASNDGLSPEDFLHWFKMSPKKPNFCFEGQIICWNKEIEY